MKTNLKRYSIVKSIVVTGFFALFFSSGLNAWTIQSLRLGDIYNSGSHDPFSGSSVSTFRNYILDTGATFTGGSLLTDYTLGSSDAVIINAPSSAYSYTQVEINILTDLLNSNTRVLIFGENSGWYKSNEQLATLVGGNYINQSGPNAQTVNSDIFPLITEGVSNITFAAVGTISPKDGNGLSLTSGDGISLWGANDNFLVFLDINAMDNSYIGGGDNHQLAQNVANFLAGDGWSPIPEPSTYGLIAGFVLLGGSMIRRRR